MIITEHKMLLFFCGCLLILMIQFARNQKREKEQFLEKAKKNVEYLAKLNRADEQIKNGQVVTKTMDELLAMEE